MRPLAPHPSAVFAFLFAPVGGPGPRLPVSSAIPVLIHLLSRQRFRIVPWAAMRFLLAAQKQSVRRMRLEQLLLLAARCAILLLLVLAMASVTPWAEAFWYKLFPDSRRPGGGQPAADAQDPGPRRLVQHGAEVGEGTSFERAGGKAAQILESSRRRRLQPVVVLARRARVVGGAVRGPRQGRGRERQSACRMAMPTWLPLCKRRGHGPPLAWQVRGPRGLFPHRHAALHLAGQPTGNLAETMRRIQGRARWSFVDVGGTASAIWPSAT